MRRFIKRKFPQRRKDAEEDRRTALPHGPRRPTDDRQLLSSPVAFGEFVDVVFGDLLEREAEFVRAG